jgi:hypothetical protein
MIHYRVLAPQLLETVIVARFLAHDVHDDRPEIENYPAGTRHPLPFISFDLIFTQRFVDPFFDPAQVRVRFPAADDQIIDQLAALAHVQDPEIDRLLAFGGSDDQLQQPVVLLLFNF